METRMTHAGAAGTAPLPETAIDALRTEFRGDLVRPSDPAYDEARRVWNQTVDRRPALVARCSGTADVVAAVRFARAHALEIAVRGGGHSVAGHGTVDAGIVIDLSPMGGVRVDRDARKAWVQGGARLGQLDWETALHGLATTAGTAADTGVGGLTLGGGYGYLARVHGLAADNLVSAELVTADGEVVIASDVRNEDLMWGLRGGGGNFGIVTGFEFRLHPIPPAVSYGDRFFALDDSLAALKAFRDFSGGMPRAMTTSASVATVSAEGEVSGIDVGAPIVLISWVYLGPLEEGRRLAAPLYAGPRARAEEVEELSYVRLQRFSAASSSRRLRRYWKGSFANSLGDDALEAFIARGSPAGDAPRWGGEVISLGGAISEVGEDDTAYSGRNAAFDFLSLTSWEDSAEDAARLAGARRYYETMKPFISPRAYVNSLEDEGAGRVRDAYGASKYDRLVALKRRYDPDNVFHLNQNIRP